MPKHSISLAGRRRLALFMIPALLLAGGCTRLHAASPKARPDFIFGADISWVQQREDQGVKYSDNGVQKDIIQILKDHHFNSIRLRIFNNPKRPGGYSPRDGYCDLEHTLAMAKRVKAAGMSFVLDFHYSDNWADPGKQTKPAAWQELHGAALEKAVHDFTRDTIEKFKAQGTAPDMVQIGNEINSGMMWPDGKLNGSEQSYDAFCGLLKAGIAGARAADPKVKIIVHIALGGKLEKTRFFLDRVIARGVKFDIIGQSYYPEYHGTIADLQANLADMAKRYPQPVMIMEYSAVPDRMGPPHVREIHDVTHAAPDGKGLGAYIWEPTMRGLFDRSGKTLPAIDMYPKMAADYAK